MGVFPFLARRPWAIGLVIVLSVYASVVFAAREIPWKDQIFERVSFEEDVKDTLRGIARQNGLQVIFREGVEGEVSFEFKMLLNAAFNKVLIENNLDYDFDPKTNLITVFSAISQQREQAIVPLSYASASSVRSAAKRFDLGGEISVDSASQTAFIEGTKEQVKAFEELVKRLDAAAGARRSAAVTRKKVALARKKSAVRKKLIQKLLDRKIEVFKLRFANVAATKTSFHGKEIKIPGIEDTLRALLGDIGKVKEGLSEKKQKELEKAKPTLAASLSFSADARTNSIIVRGTQEDIDKVRRVVEELDRPVPMVEIDVMIVRAQRGISKTLGVNWAYERAITGSDHTRFIGLNTGVGSADPSAITNGIGSTADTGAAGGAGLNTVAATTGTSAVVDDIASATQSIVAGLVLQQFSPAGALTWALQTQLEAFEQDNKTQTIASPTLVTLNNVAARIERRASQFFDVGQNETATLQEVDVGLSLDITPVVIPREDASEEELIRLTIRARNTTISAGTFAASTAATSGQEIETEVIIPAGRTYMIGGLVDDSRIDNEKGVPFLMDLPILGHLFRTDSSSDEFVETIFFITPRVIHSEEILSRDIAERRYVEGRRFGLAQTRADIQESSRVLDNRAAFSQEDE